MEIDVWRQPLDEVVGVACGAEHSLLLSVSGQVYGSGCNAYGQVCVCIQKTIYPFCFLKI